MATGDGGDPEDEGLSDLDHAAELEALGVDVHAWWLHFWARLELSDIAGFPAWEGQVFALLERFLPILSAVFHHYARVRLAASPVQHRGVCEGAGQ
jgi:hypothetical protein